VPEPLIVEGGVDSPAEGDVTYGSLEVTGWAFSHRASIESVQVFFDRKFLGNARYGYRRPDVVATLPRVTQIDCGFGAHFLLRGVPGPGYVVVEITDALGNKLRYERIISIKEVACGLHGSNACTVEVDVEELMLRLQKQIAESELAARRESNGVY